MIRSVLTFLLLISMAISQDVDIKLPPDKGIEFKLNTLSGVILDEETGEPVMDVIVELFTGNNILKHSLLTDEDGSFSKDNIGYLWKPRIRLDLNNYKRKTFSITPEQSDSFGNMHIEQKITPLPENQRIINLNQSTITKRAEIFFIKGNVFYNLRNKRVADKIIIKTVEAIELKEKYISMKVNGKMYDISKCYVPQNGKYENLSFILQSLLSEPIFKESGLPVYLPEYMLEPTVIFGSVIDKENGHPIPGAEIVLSEAWNKTTSFSGNDSLSISRVMPMAEYFANIDKKDKKDKKFYNFRYNTFKRRVSHEKGRFAFTVTLPGVYQLEITPPLKYSNSVRGKPNILVKYGRGGWYKSDFLLQP